MWVLTASVRGLVALSLAPRPSDWLAHAPAALRSQRQERDRGDEPATRTPLSKWKILFFLESMLMIFQV